MQRQTKSDGGKLLRLLLLWLTLMVVIRAVSAFANVASPLPFHVRQPDGTELTLHVRGDEWFHWYETVEGYAVSLDPSSGFWVYLQPSVPGTNVLSAQRVGRDLPPGPPWHPSPSREQLSRRHVKPSVFPQKAHARQGSSSSTTATPMVVPSTPGSVGYVPVLLGNFSDTTPTLSVNTLSNLLFATGPSVRSMATFYSEVSYGQFTVATGPSGIQNWLTMPNTQAYYGATNPAVAGANDIRPAQFVRDLVVAAVKAGYNFFPYDQDGDGKVDVVCVVHAGMGEEFGGGPNTIWSHRSSLSAALGANGPVVVQSASGQIIIDDYIIEPEVQPKAAGVGTDPIGIGVFCHEYGHALGLPDLYDPTYVSRGVGNWSVMSYGSHNGLVRDGDCPAHFDAWCKVKLGWLTPINYTLNYPNVPFPAAAQTGFAARLWKDGLSASQYFLVENRYQTNFDEALPSSGLLIWHIDDSKGVLGDNTDNTQPWYPSVGTFAANTNSGNYHVALVQADNLWQLETKQSVGNAGDPFPGSSNNRVFGPNTAPNSYAYNNGLTPGYNSYVAVSNISDAGPVMTADLYTRSPNSGPAVDWVNIGGVVPPSSGAQFVQLDAYHPVVVKALPGISGTALSQFQLYINRAADGRWWNFTSQQWETNATSSNYNVSGSEQNGLTLAFQNNFPNGTNLLNGTYTFIVRVINAQSIVTELQMAMTATHAPEVVLNLTDNSVVNTLTNFTAVATESSGLGVQRVEIALYWDGAATEGGRPVRWFWSGSGWTTTPLWLGADFPTHPAQATLYYPIGPDASDLLTEKQYTIAARAVDALGDAATNTVSVFYDPGPAATVYWRYPASGNWFDAGNWTPSRVPTASDHVVVNAPGDYTVTLNGSINLASLRFGRVVGLGRQHLVIPAGVWLTLDSANTNKIYANGALDLGGSLSVGRLQCSGGSTWNWTNGTFAGTADLKPGAVLAISGSAQKNLGSGAVINNAGTVNWSGPGLLYNYGYYSDQPAKINNLRNGAFNLLTSGQVFSHDYNESVFNNQPGARFVCSVGTNIINNFIFNNQGEVRLGAGALLFNDYLNLQAGGSFTGAGRCQFATGTLTMDGTTTLDATTFQFLSGSMTGNAGSALQTTNNGLFDWQGGYLGGSVEVAAGAQFAISGTATKTMSSGARLRNRGTISWRDTGVIYNYGYYLDGRATIDNLGTFQILGDGLMVYDYNSSFFTNRPGATVIKSASAGTTRFDWSFSNDGEVAVNSGALALNAGGNSSGSFSVGAGALVRFTGGTQILNGGVTLSGAGHFQIDGGTVTRAGDLSAAPSAILDVMSGTLDGTGALAQSFVVNWTGGTIGGQLDAGPAVVFNATGGGTKTLGGGARFNNAGTFNWSSGGPLYTFAYYGEQVSAFNNLSNSVFNLLGDGTVFIQDYNRCFFTNSPGALFVKSAGTGTNFINRFQIENHGQIRAETGTIAFTDLLDLQDGSQLTGAGTVRLSGMVNLQGQLACTGNLVLEGGSLTGALTTNGTPAAFFSGPGSFSWTGGTLGGGFVLQKGSTLNLSGPNTKVLGGGAIFDNYGVVNWSGPGLIYNTAYYYWQPATFNNRSNAVFALLDDGTVFNCDYNRSYFVNFPGAVLSKSAGMGTNFLGAFGFESSGDIRVPTGAISFTTYLGLNPGASLSGGGAVRFASDVRLNGTVAVSCPTYLDSGVLTGTVGSNAVYTGTGPLTWLGGTLAGAVTLQQDSTMNLTGAGDKTLGAAAVLNNAGTINWSGPGRLYNSAYYLDYPATINNQSGAVFNLLADGQVFANEYNRSTFNNRAGATFAKVSGTGSNQLNSFAFNQFGEVNAQSGTLEFNDVLDLYSGCTFSGAGMHLISGGTTTLRGTAGINHTTLRLSGGTLVGDSSAATPVVGTPNGGLFDWTGGYLAGMVNFGTGSTCTISGSATKWFSSGAVLNNLGNVSWSGTGNLHNYAYYNGQQATINNQAGAVFTCVSDAVLDYDYNASTFNNAPGAVFRKSGSVGSTVCGWTFNNSGGLEVLSGELAVTDGGLNLLTNSTVSLQLSGTAPGSQYGRLTRNGALALGGVLQATLANGFVPTNGMTFNLVNYNGYSGQFSPVNLPPVPRFSTWQVNYGNGGVVAQVVPATMIQGGGMASGTFQFSITGQAASACVVEASTNMVNWVPVLTNAPFNGTVNFVEPSTGRGPRRFFRANLVP